MSTLAAVRQQGSSALNDAVSLLSPAGGVVVVKQVIETDAAGLRAKPISLEVEILSFLFPPDAPPPAFFAATPNHTDRDDGGLLALFSAAFLKAAAKAAGQAEPIAIQKPEADLSNASFNEKPSLDWLKPQVEKSTVVFAANQADVDYMAQLKKDLGPALPLQTLVVADHLIIPDILKPFVITASELKAKSEQREKQKERDLALAEQQLTASLRSDLVIDAQPVAQQIAKPAVKQQNEPSNFHGDGYFSWIVGAHPPQVNQQLAADQSIVSASEPVAIMQSTDIGTTSSLTMPALIQPDLAKQISLQEIAVGEIVQADSFDLASSFFSRTLLADQYSDQQSIALDVPVPNKNVAARNLPTRQQESEDILIRHIVEHSHTMAELSEYFANLNVLTVSSPQFTSAVFPGAAENNTALDPVIQKPRDESRLLRIEALEREVKEKLFEASIAKIVVSAQEGTSAANAIRLPSNELSSRKQNPNKEQSSANNHDAILALAV